VGVAAPIRSSRAKSRDAPIVRAPPTSPSRQREGRLAALAAAGVGATPADRLKTPTICATCNAMPAIIFPIAGIAAWLGSTFGPIAIAILFWRFARRRSGRWWVHLLFVPAMLAVEGACIWLLFFAAHDDGDGALGLGIALLPPLAFFITAFVGYFAALGFETTSRIWARSHNG